MTDYRDPNMRDPEYRAAARSSNAMWGWIAGVVFVIVVLFLAFGTGGDGERQASTPASPPATTGAAPPPATGAAPRTTTGSGPSAPPAAQAPAAKPPANNGQSNPQR
jgi:hypothetical protein